MKSKNDEKFAKMESAKKELREVNDIIEILENTKDIKVVERESSDGKSKNIAIFCNGGSYLIEGKSIDLVKTPIMTALKAAQEKAQKEYDDLF